MHRHDDHRHARARPSAPARPTDGSGSTSSPTCELVARAAATHPACRGRRRPTRSCCTRRSSWWPGPRCCRGSGPTQRDGGPRCGSSPSPTSSRPPDRRCAGRRAAPPLDFDSIEQAAGRLVAAIDAGDLDDVDPAAGWLGPDRLGPASCSRLLGAARRRPAVGRRPRADPPLPPAPGLAPRRDHRRAAPRRWPASWPATPTGGSTGSTTVAVRAAAGGAAGARRPCSTRWPRRRRSGPPDSTFIFPLMSGGRHRAAPRPACWPRSSAATTSPSGAGPCCGPRPGRCCSSRPTTRPTAGATA